MPSQRSVSNPPSPPSPPDVPRSVRLYPYQGAALTIFTIVVVLALFGVFGESAAMTEESRGALRVRVEHPSRLRHLQTEALRVWVSNASNAPFDTVTVTFDTAYVNRFENVAFTPSADEAYVVRLIDVPGGATRLVDVDLRASDYGRHRGSITVGAGGADAVRIAIRTFVFP